MINTSSNFFCGITCGLVGKKLEEGYKKVKEMCVSEELNILFC